MGLTTITGIVRMDRRRMEVEGGEEEQRYEEGYGREIDLFLHLDSLWIKRRCYWIDHLGSGEA